MKKFLGLGALAIVIAALFWSVDGVFLRPNLYTLPSTFVVFLEHLLGFIVLSPFIYLYRHELKKITRKQWVAVFWVALFGGALGTTFITKALFLTNFQGLSVVVLLQKLQPIFAIVLAAFLLKEKFPKKFYLWAGLAIIGGYLVTFKDLAPNLDTGQKTILAAVFALLAAFAWGSSTTIGKYALKNINYRLLAALRFGFTTVIMTFAVFYRHTWAIPSPRQWLIFAIIVFTTGATAMFLYYFGLKRVPASVATLCELAWPVSAPILDYFINHNLLSWSQIVGAIVLIYAVYKTTQPQFTIRQIIKGKVIPGQGVGRLTGYKTANLDPQLATDLETGVYPCEVRFGQQIYIGLLHYGPNSFRDGQTTLEIFIKNFDQDIYNQQIEVEIMNKIRDIKPFADSQSLTKQIKKDLGIIENL
ncbi:MAG: EamA family transporter [Patescibacteria group bacterium]